MQRCSALASPPPAPGLEEAPAGALILRLGSRAMECHTIPGPASQERVPRGPVYGEQPTPNPPSFSQSRQLSSPATRS